MVTGKIITIAILKRRMNPQGDFESVYNLRGRQSLPGNCIWLSTRIHDKEGQDGQIWPIGLEMDNVSRSYASSGGNLVKGGY